MIEFLILIALVAGLVFAVPAIRRWVKAQDAVSIDEKRVDKILADHEGRIATLEQKNEPPT